MIYLEAPVKGAAEKTIAAMFFVGIMSDAAIKELTDRFGSPKLISKFLISKLLDMPAFRNLKEGSSERSLGINEKVWHGRCSPEGTCPVEGC